MYTRNSSRRPGVVVHRLAGVAVAGSPVREKAPVPRTEGTDMSTTTKKRMFAAASAVAIGSAGLLICPPFAKAIDCIQWGFPGDVLIQEPGTGWSVFFSGTGSTIQGPATAKNTNGEVRNGTISANIFSDDSVDIAVQTPQGNQRYQGKVGGDGKASGKTVGQYGGIPWVTQFPLSCIKQPDPVAAPAPAPAPAPAQGTAAVVGEDVDVYNIAHGEEPDENGVAGVIIGTLRVGQQVGVPGPCNPNDWCKVSSPEIPGGTGFVFGHIRPPN
jgi:hypothetical protein